MISEQAYIDLEKFLSPQKLVFRGFPKIFTKL